MTSQIEDVPERWPVVASAGQYRGKIISVRTDTVRVPEATTMEREVVEHPGAVGILALDEHDRVLMIRQYRHPVGQLLWELPAGLRDVAGEPTAQAARRELLEETGYQARDWHVLADYFSSPGISTERLRVFLARGLHEVPVADRAFVPENEEAHLILDWVPLDQAVSLVLAGELHNGVAVVGLLAAHIARRSGFAGLRDADAPEVNSAQ
ncbi:MAG TPA: NUDIX hydrolase [Streptosporangiaceae bacterium]|jgi:ADP-ribose pyrophosphatase|nr:NUDIX hydrolase [Streptosporangiaceae bacterium]